MPDILENGGHVGGLTPLQIGLANPKYAKIKGPDGSVIGLAQGITISDAYNTERILEVGETTTLPVSGAKVATVVLRRLFVPNESLLKVLNPNASDKTDFINLAALSKTDLTGMRISLELNDVSWNRTFTLEGYINSWTMSYDAGSVQVFEDVTIECKYV